MIYHIYIYHNVILNDKSVFVKRRTREYQKFDILDRQPSGKLFIMHIGCFCLTIIKKM